MNGIAIIYLTEKIKQLTLEAKQLMATCISVFERSADYTNKGRYFSLISNPEEQDELILVTKEEAAEIHRGMKSRGDEHAEAYNPDTCALFKLTSTDGITYKDIQNELAKHFMPKQNRGGLKQKSKKDMAAEFNVPPAKKTEEVTNKGVAEALIVGWERLSIEEGVDFPYSVDNAYTLVKNFPEIRDAIVSAASDPFNFRKQSAEAVREQGNA